MTIRRVLARTLTVASTANAVRRGPKAVARRAVRRRAHRTLARALTRIVGR